MKHAEAETTIGSIESYMTADHARLDALLRNAQRDDGSIDDATYTEFRGGLLRHIGMEEKVLLPFAREKRNGTPLHIAAQLRADHSRIAKLLVRTPTPALLDELRRELALHNAIEEGAQGLYATCDALAGSEAISVVDRMRAQPQVPLAKYYDGPLLTKR